MRIELDHRARITLADEEARRFLDEPHLEGLPWDDSFIPDRLSGAWRSLSNHVLAGKNPPEAMTIPVRLRSGRELEMSWSFAIARDPGGGVRGMVLQGRQPGAASPATRRARRAKG
ncbi:MAG: PAS domain-containing protein [Acidobacteriota bacterium]